MCCWKLCFREQSECENHNIIYGLWKRPFDKGGRLWRNMKEGKQRWALRQLIVMRTRRIVEEDEEVSKQRCWMTTQRMAAVRMDMRGACLTTHKSLFTPPFVFNVPD